MKAVCLPTSPLDLINRTADDQLLPLMTQQQPSCGRDRESRTGAEERDREAVALGSAAVQREKDLLFAAGRVHIMQSFVNLLDRRLALAQRLMVAPPDWK